MQDRIDPVTSFNNLINGWWKIAVIAIIGGMLGLVFSFIKPPSYQAEAVFHASIDFTEINYENMVGEYGNPLIFTQYDEDLALQVVQRALRSEMAGAFEYAQTLDPNLDMDTFQRDMQIRRYLAQWFLRYRHEDPQVAQSIVNFWAENGLAALREAQEAEIAETFVMVDLVYEAHLPQKPVYQNRNTLVLAGTTIGLLSGIIYVDFGDRFYRWRIKEA